MLNTNQIDIQPLSNSWKVRNRNNLERLASGDPVQLLTVFRGLYDIKEQAGTLNLSDRKQLNLALSLLADEFSYAFKESIDETKERLACDARDKVTVS